MDYGIIPESTAIHSDCYYRAFFLPLPNLWQAGLKVHTRYQTQKYGERRILHWITCDIHFSDSFATPLSWLQTSPSRIAQILTARSEGMSLNATPEPLRFPRKVFSIGNGVSPI